MVGTPTQHARVPCHLATKRSPALTNLGALSAVRGGGAY